MGIGAWSNFKKSWIHQASMQVATLSVLIGSFTVLTLAMLFQQNLGRILTHWGQDIRVSVYLSEVATEAETSSVKKFIDESMVFSNVQYLSKQDAAKQFKSKVGEYAPGLLSDFDFDNPLPASFEMSIAGGLNSSWSYDKIKSLAAQFKSMSGVEDISYGQGWVENYAAVLRVFSITSGVFVLALLSGSLFVIGNSIRNSIIQRRDEIEILELFGATKRMIIWPYVFEGIMMGLMAALFAVFITYALYLWQVDIVSSELTFWSFTTKIQFLSGPRVLMVLVAGAALGGLGAFLWARKVATGWAAAEVKA